MGAKVLPRFESPTIWLHHTMIEHFVSGEQFSKFDADLQEACIKSMSALVILTKQQLVHLSVLSSARMR
jgi:hypothetical protein